MEQTKLEALLKDTGVFVMNDTLAWQNFSSDFPTIMVYDLSIDYENEQLRAGTKAFLHN